MTTERYQQLDESGTGLTDQEIDQGYHWCLDFDSLLVGPDCGEWSVCGCFSSQQRRDIQRRYPNLIPPHRDLGLNIFTEVSARAVRSGLENRATQCVIVRLDLPPPTLRRSDEATAGLDEPDNGDTDRATQMGGERITSAIYFKHASNTRVETIHA